MSTKEDSKKHKSQQKHIDSKIEDICPKEDLINSQGLNFFDLSPFSPVIKTVRKSFQYNSPHYDLAMINTPVGIKRQKSFIEEVEEQGHHKISMVLGFDGVDQSNVEMSQSYFNEESYEEHSHSKSGQKQPEHQDQFQVKSPQNHQLKKNDQKQEQHVIIIDKSLKRKPKPLSNTVRTVTCNCKKTKCLKLYCDCFRQNRLCDESCNCTGCHNTFQYEAQRNGAILCLLDRNPQAFKPKLEAQQHAKGCNCKKSGCMKKYCECFQAGMNCGQYCRCQECKNSPQKHCTDILKREQVIKR